MLPGERALRWSQQLAARSHERLMGGREGSQTTSFKHTEFKILVEVSKFPQRPDNNRRNACTISHIHIWFGYAAIKKTPWN